MPRLHHRSPRASLTVEPLEGRSVPSHIAAMPAMVGAKAINLADGSGAGAILSAVNGGPGNEFVTLIRRQVPNVNAVLRQFVTGRRDALQVAGFAVKRPHLEPGYTGPQLDQFNPTAAGAALLRDGRLELGAILRGPIDLPIATTYVWGIDRGGGAAGPAGFGPSGVNYDAFVSVTRTGSSVSASVADLKAGTTTSIDPANVNIQASTIRVFLSDPARLLPSTGRPLNNTVSPSGPGAVPRASPR